LTLHLESREYIAFAPGGCTISTVEMRDAFSDKLFIKDLKDSYSLFLTNSK